MAQAFNEMGWFGKIVVVAIAASTVKSCAQHIAETVRMNKAAKAK